MGSDADGSGATALQARAMEPPALGFTRLAQISPGHFAPSCGDTAANNKHSGGCDSHYEHPNQGLRRVE